MKKYIFLLIALLSSVSSWAVETYKTGTITYKVYDTAETPYASVYQDSSSVKKLTGTVTIPASISYNETDYPVTKIERWYYGNEVDLILPNSIEKESDVSWSYVHALNSLKLPESFTSFNLVSVRSAIRTLIVPKTVTSITIPQYSSSYGTRVIGAVDVDADNPNYASIDGVLFNKTKSTLIFYPYLKSGKSYTVPNGVTTIGSNAFWYNDNLEKITISEGVTTIEEGAFRQNSNLYECILPTTLTAIGNYAFRDANKLEKCELPANITTIGNYAFYSCRLNPANNYLVLPGSLTSIGEYAFYGFKNPGSTTVEIPASLGLGQKETAIGNYAFYCSTIDSKITEPINVDYYAFSSVSRIYVPQGTLDMYKEKTGWNTYPENLKEVVPVDPSLQTVKLTASETIDEVNTLIKVTFAADVEGAQIRYKVFSGTDSSDPSEWPIYNESGATPAPAVDVNPNGYTVKAIATKAGMNPSEIFSKTYDLASMSCKTPTIICESGSTTMTISNSTEGATIEVKKYAKGTDGDYTTLVSTETYTSPLVLNGNFKYEAISKKAGMFTSSSANKYVDWFNCSQPSISYVASKPDGNTVIVTVTGTDPANEHYKYRVGSGDYLDYTVPIEVGQDSYFYAYTERDNYNPSGSVSIYTYRSNITTPKPTIAIDQEANTLTFSSDEGADIYYTLDGTTPIVTAEQKYTGVISLTGNCQVYAIAHKDGKFKSDVASTSINWFACADVVMAQDIINGQAVIRLSTTTEGATIRYGINGRDYYSPEYNTEYTEPFGYSDGDYIYAIAMKDGYNNSNWVDARFYYPDGTVRCAQPSIYLDNENKLVTMSTDETNGKIFYTLDGTTPTTASTLYETPFTSEVNCTIKAITARDPETVDEVTTTYANSYVVERNLDDWFRVQEVIFQPVLGDAEGEYKMALIAEEGAEIYYGINQGAYILYTDTFAVSAGDWVYALARKDGYVDSYERDFRISEDNYQVRIPNVYLNDVTREIVVTPVTYGSTIYYTYDKSDPDPASSTTFKVEKDTIKIVRNGTYKFIAVKDRMTNSSVQSYNIEWFRVPEVTITPIVQDNVLKVKLECEDADAIYYGINEYESETITANANYTEPFEVPDGARVYASAVKDGYSDAYWTNSGWIYRSNYTCATPTITVAADTTVTIASNGENETIYYTLNGDDPTTSSTKFTSKFKLQSNVVIKAIAVASDKLNSSVRTREYSGFKVSSVVITPIVVDNKVKVELTSTTPNAQIYYNINTTLSPVSSNIKYTGPFEINDGDYIHANALKDGYNEAGWTSHSWIYFGDYTSNRPTITVNSNNTVSISGDEGATFYYTIGGETPTTSSTKYTSEFAMSRNDTIKAIAVQEGKLISGVTWTYCSGFTVSTVVITPIVVDNKMKVKLETATPGAKIYYAINENNPTTTLNMNYTEPFDIANGDYIYANAVKEGYSEAGWSTHEWIYYNNYTCSQPTITVRADTMVVMSADEGATIYYTLDGTDPTTSSTKYISEFKLTRNASIKAIAIGGGKMNSGIRERVYNGFNVKNIDFALNGIKMTLTSETPGVTFNYCYENDPREEVTGNLVYSRTYTGPFDMEYNGYIYVRASRDGYNSAESNYWVSGLVKWAKPEALSFDGHKLVFKDIPGAQIWYTTNGDYPEANYRSTLYKDSILISNTGVIRAIAVGDYKNQSDIAEIEIKSFASETGAVSDKAGGLADAMAWKGDLGTITDYTIAGPINSDDMAFIKDKMTSLQTLDLSGAQADGGIIPDNAFAGMPLVMFSSPNALQSVGHNIFSGCKELAAVVWNTTAKIPNDAFDKDVNPNLLVFVPAEDAAPNNSSARNIIVNNTADHIYLSDGADNNFYSPKQFYTKSITYTHDFKLTTGSASGWETICLPFDCSYFVHESKGELKPFVEYDGLSDKGNYKPFWLRELTDIGYKDVKKIEAHKPYLISMPNNESYASRYRLNGKVTFSATNVYVPQTVQGHVEKGDITMYANFMNVSETSEMLLLNTEADADHEAGSIFVLNSGRAIRPFEAYVISRARSRAYISMSALGGGTDDDATAITEHTIDDSNMVKVYNLSGVLVKQSSKEDALKGLAKGVYIVNGKRMIVK